MEKEIYIIRHGETDFNKMGIAQGRGVNASLNALGMAQGAAFYQHYKHLRFDKVYTSTLQRTHQTVQGFLQDELPWQQLAGLDELSFGIWEGHADTDERKQVFNRILQCWNEGNCDLAFENGESPNQVAQRLKEALEVIISADGEKRVLVCMHGRSLLILLCLLSKMPVSRMTDFKHQNTGLYRLQYKNGEFSILEMNDVKHLEALASLTAG
ncbi:histidine phosphatase family protein [Chitinophaga barathri]|uniref:Histidine phosphatase family protein n=1 Tax=Chitinophaga barathri TaxID=1647451 RepID=A0A3N4MIM1_9BACT|nr:histidine phosphatase family protein [Chitinophaga barathri]RPD39509.1 histidine phosphatase family protein [Chitinophaga barathri]